MEHNCDLEIGLQTARAMHQDNEIQPCLVTALETGAENTSHQARSQEMRNNRARKSNFRLQGYIYQVRLRTFAELCGMLFSVQLFFCTFSVSRHTAGGLDRCKAPLFVTYLLMQGRGQREATNAFVIVQCFSSAVVTHAAVRHLEQTH